MKRGRHPSAVDVNSRLLNPSLAAGEHRAQQVFAMASTGEEHAECVYRGRHHRGRHWVVPQSVRFASAQHLADVAHEQIGCGPGRMEALAFVPWGLVGDCPNQRVFGLSRCPGPSYGGVAGVGLSSVDADGCACAPRRASASRDSMSFLNSACSEGTC